MSVMPVKFPLIVKLLNSKYIVLLDILALIVFWVSIYFTFNDSEYNLAAASLAGYLWGVAGTLLWLNETRPKWLFGPFVTHKRVLGPKAILTASVLWPISMLIFYILMLALTVFMSVGEFSSGRMFGKKRR